MPDTLRIGLIGDYHPDVIAHQAIPPALEVAAAELGVSVAPQWLPTNEIDGSSMLEPFDGLWCVPASPYRSMEGALSAIRFAREAGVPFLGTCGGFQHAVIEYARNVLGWADADHAETAPGAGRAVIAPLACSLVEVTDVVRFTPQSRLATAYGSETASEGYHCNYGLNPAFVEALTEGQLRVTAVDAHGDVRGLELEGHPFYVLTLFQPERLALTGVVPPIVRPFLRAAAALRSRRLSG